VLYSNRRPEDAAFVRELLALEQQHPPFTLLATMTALSQSSEPWSGLQGPIDEPLLMRATADLTRPIYYVAGPPAMAEGLRLTLGDAGVADDAIRSEEFYGY
jgi:ferredoxin-NADP reductase